MNLLDAVFLGILGYTAWRGYNKGIFASLSAAGGYVAGLIGTYLFYEPFRRLMVDKVQVGQALSPWVAEKLALPAAAFETTIQNGAINKALQFLEAKQLPDFMKDILAGYLGNLTKLPGTKGITSLGDGIIYMVSEFLVSALCLILLLVGIVVVFRIILPRMFKAVSPRPVALLDRIGGALLGSVVGIVIVFGLSMLLIPASSLSALTGNEGPLTLQVQNSNVVKLFLTHSQTVLSTFFQSKSV